MGEFAIKKVRETAGAVVRTPAARRVRGGFRRRGRAAEKGCLGGSFEQIKSHFSEIIPLIFLAFLWGLPYNIDIELRKEVMRLEEAIWDLFLVFAGAAFAKLLDIAEKAWERRKTPSKPGKHERRS